MKRTRNGIHAWVMVSCMLGTLIFSGIVGNQTILAKNKKITFHKKNVTLYIGKSTKLTVKEKVNKKNLLWYSTNRKVAKVSKNGVVKGIKTGSANVYARLRGSKKKALCKVKVGKYITGLKISSATNVILDIGADAQVNAEILPKNAATKGILYQSANSSVATVSKKGIVTAVSPGVTQIKIVSEGVNKKNKKLSSYVNVYVQERIGNVPDPVIPNPNIVVPNDTPAPGEGNHNGVGSGNGGNANNGNHSGNGDDPNEKDKTQTLQEKINNIVPPSNNQLIAAQFSVNDNGNVSTLYFLNKAFSGNVTITLNGKSFNKNESVISVLTKLQNDYKAYTNDSNTIKISRRYGQEWWTLTDYSINKNYRLKAWLNDTVYNSPYGLMIAEGDTLSEIVIN